MIVAFGSNPVAVARKMFCAGTISQGLTIARRLGRGQRFAFSNALTQRSLCRRHRASFRAPYSLACASIPAVRCPTPNMQGERKLSPATAHKVWVSFKSMLKSAHCAHLADNISIKKGKRARPLEIGKDIPTPDEVKRIIAAAGDNLKLSTLLRTAALTGLRASELLGLRWHDVDLTRHEINVRQRSDRYRVIGAPKSAGSIRTIPIGPDLVHVLKQWKLACPKGEADLVFPSKNGVVWHYDNCMRAVYPVMCKAGVVDKAGEPKYALHAFRHFFASWCINPKDRGGRELPAKVVQEWLGHSSIKMTLDIYGHLFPRSSDSAEIAASEKALFG